MTTLQTLKKWLVATVDAIAVGRSLDSSAAVSTESEETPLTPVQQAERTAHRLHAAFLLAHAELCALPTVSQVDHRNELLEAAQELLTEIQTSPKSPTSTLGGMSL